MQTLFNRGVRKAKRIAMRKLTALRSPLNVALIGFGEIAPDHVDAYESTGIARVVAVCDLRPPNLARALWRWPFLRAYRDYRTMLREIRPDVVSVCTWPPTHAPIVAAAAAAGVKGILCEKPLALRLSDIELMEANCAERGVKLACGHQYRFHPNFVRAAEMIRSGTLGRVASVAGQIRGTLADNGPHLVDTVRFLLGDPPALQATCRCDRQRGRCYQGFPSEDSSTGAILFDGDIRFDFQTGERAADFFQIRVHGAAGSLEITPQTLTIDGSQPPRLVKDDDYRKTQFAEFLQWIKGQRDNYIADSKQASQSAQLVLALYESARLGTPIELPLSNRGDIIHQLYPDGMPDNGDPPPVATVTVSGGGQASRTTADRLAMDGGRRVLKSWFKGNPRVGVAEMTNVARVLVSRQMNCTEGTMVQAFEKAAAELYGSPHAVASTSGTAAIHVALGALNLRPGDEVITTPLTDMGTVIPILASNCLPIFADVDPETGNLTDETIACKITPRTRAVILVHLFGRPANMDSICGLVRERGISLIEDCSQAHYAEYHGRKVGTFGDFGCFSFQQSKQITCGDGGLTLVNREDLASRAAMFADKGWDREHGTRNYLFLGMNYRMTELQGAVALAQLRRLSGLIQARREAAESLTRQLREIPGILVPPEQDGVSPSWWMYSFGIEEDHFGVRTKDFCEALQVEGVIARQEYLPEPLFECDTLKRQQTYGDSRYPFSAFPYQSPDVRDFPGFQQFNRRIIIFWSHDVLPQHVAGIAEAVRKVAALLPTASVSAPSRALMTVGAGAARLSLPT